MLVANKRAVKGFKRNFVIKRILERGEKREQRIRLVREMNDTRFEQKIEFKKRVIQFRNDMFAKG